MRKFGVVDEYVLAQNRARQGSMANPTGAGSLAHQTKKSYVSAKSKQAKPGARR
jgi:hypothetical protein